MRHAEFSAKADARCGFDEGLKECRPRGSLGIGSGEWTVLVKVCSISREDLSVGLGSFSSLVVEVGCEEFPKNVIMFFSFDGHFCVSCIADSSLDIKVLKALSASSSEFEFPLERVQRPMSYWAIVSMNLRGYRGSVLGY